MTKAISRLKATAALDSLTLTDFKKRMQKLGFLFKRVEGGTGFNMEFVPNANYLQSNWKGKALVKEDVASGTAKWKVSLRSPAGVAVEIADTPIPLGRWSRFLALFTKGMDKMKASTPKPSKSFKAGQKVSGRSFTSRGGSTALVVTGPLTFSVQQGVWCYPVMIDGVFDSGKKPKTTYLFNADKLTLRQE